MERQGVGPVVAGSVREGRVAPGSIGSRGTGLLSLGATAVAMHLRGQFVTLCVLQCYIRNDMVSRDL